ncbi:MAG: ATP-binding protein [Deltaproteobacteria bacterium]|nr:ATP-binding protein [Deltaproteobacteria bacterium]
MYTRHIQKSVVEALNDTSVVVINGARQTGKSTFCEQLIKDNLFKAQYVTFDDPTALSAAQSDPGAFIEGLKKHVVLDEIQRVRGLLLTIKKFVDQDRKGIRFILTGSADVMTLPKVSESLAGRIEVHNLWPLSIGEIQGCQSSFLKTLISEEVDFQTSNYTWNDLTKMMGVGGYPEALKRPSEVRREKWFKSYINSILQKDIRELANIDGLVEIPNVLELIAGRVGGILNLSDLSRLSGIPSTTMQRYYALLQHVFLVKHIPAWRPNLEGRVVKAPKVFLNDTGLLCYLRGEGADSFLKYRDGAGPILENFVVMEIIKQLSWSDISLKPYHFRTHKGVEVDIVLESRKKQLYGIEVKTSSSVRSKDFKGLKYLKDLKPENFKKGVLFYTGNQVIKFGENLYAVPMSTLWL